MLKFKDFIKENYIEYNIGDNVLIRYWLTGDVTPVKIIEKKGENYFVVSHKIDGSNLFNAPDHGVKKNEILGYYNETINNKSPFLNPDVSGQIPTWRTWNNEISF